MRIIYWMFLLMMVLILVQYATGTTQTVATFGKGITAIIYALTGRDSEGRWLGADRGSGAIV